MSGEAFAVLCGLSCMFLPSFLLQITGFFSTNWVKLNATSDCTQGLFYTKDCPENTQDLPSSALGLQATALTIISLTTIFIVCFICCSGDDGDDDDGVGCCGSCVGCFLVLYPIAGILGFSGCMVIVADYPGSSLGWSFFVSLTASCYIILEMFCCYCMIYRAAKDDDSGVGGSSQEQGVAVTASSGSVVQGGYGSGGVLAGQVMEHQEVSISDTGMLMVRKLRITRLVHMRSSWAS